MVHPHSPSAQPAHNVKQARERESDETYCADALDTEPRRSQRKCHATRRFSPERIYVDKTKTATEEREITMLERRAVTAELRAIGLQPDVKRTLLLRVPASAANKLLASFRRDQPFMVGHTFWHCDPILPRMAAGVNIEVTTLIPEFQWLRVGDRGKITQIRQDTVHVTFAPSLHVTSACPPANASASMPQCTAQFLPSAHDGLLQPDPPQQASVTGVGRQPPPPPPPPPVDELQRPVLPTSTILQTGPVLIGLTTQAPGPKMQVPSQNQRKVKLMPQHMSCVTTVKEGRQWRVLDIAPSVTTGILVVYAAPADDPARRGGTLSNTCAEFDLLTVKGLLQQAGVVFPARQAPRQAKGTTADDTGATLHTQFDLVDRAGHDSPAEAPDSDSEDGRTVLEIVLGDYSEDESSSDASEASQDSVHDTHAASPHGSASAARAMQGSPTKRARLASDLTAASGADLPQEGPFFGRARKTKCADTADCAFGQGGWQGSPGPFDAVHGTQVTVTLTGARDDGMEVEVVGDTADRRGDDAEAGARMDCDNGGDESGVPWVTVL